MKKFIFTAFQWGISFLHSFMNRGMIAQELCYLLQDRVASLTLASTYSKFAGIPLLKNDFIGMPQTALYNFLVSSPSKTVAEFARKNTDFLFPPQWLNQPCAVSKQFETNRDYTIDFLESRYNQVGLQSKAGKFRQQLACVSHYFDSRLHDIKKHLKGRILVLAGDEDYVLLQPHSSVYLAHVLDARLEIYPSGGHALRFQDPKWHNQLYYDFLTL
jgi:pimeloyl-ACP methyl ester carboxylesterase